MALTKWEEWHTITVKAAHILGCTIEDLGERRVKDVLKALYAVENEPASSPKPVTCTKCRGLALEVDSEGRCHRCAP